MKRLIEYFKLFKADDPLVLYYLFFVLVIFLFLTIKATNTSFTHDEAFTYLYFADYRYFDPFAFFAHSNNHLLNSVLMGFFNFFSQSETILRLPNLLSFLVFAYFLFKYISIKSNSLLIISPLILLIPFFFLDFFTLARGYGIGLALTMTGYYYYSKYIQTKNHLYLKNFYISAFLAILANFIHIYAFGPILTLELVQLIKQFSTKTLRMKYLIRFIFLSGVTWMPIFLINFLRKQFYFGGAEGFLQDTVLGFANQDFQGFFVQIFTSFFLVYVLGMLITQIILYYRKRKILIVNFSLIFGIILLNLLFYLFQIKLPIGRAALWIFLLFFLAFVELFDVICMYLRTKLNFVLNNIFVIFISRFFVFVLAATMLLFAFKKPDIKETYDWKYNSCDKEAMALVTEGSVVLVDWLNAGSWEYYNLYNQKNLVIVWIKQAKMKSSILREEYLPIDINNYDWDFAYLSKNEMSHFSNYNFEEKTITFTDCSEYRLIQK